MPLSRPAKWLATTIVILLLLAMVGLLGLRYYLSSEHVIVDVRSRLEKLFGGQVQVGEADIGVLGDSSVKDVQFLDDNSKPLLKLDEVKADVSAVGMLFSSGNAQRLTIKGAALTLRWNEEGHFLTTLPKMQSTSGEGTTSTFELPALALEDSKLFLMRDDETAAIIDGINATLTKSGDNYQLDGTVRSATWGDWKINSTLSPGQNVIALQLTSEKPVNVSRGQLATLPFIPPSAAKSLDAEGKCNGDMALSLNVDSGTLHYTVHILPVDNTVHFPDLDLTATHIDRGKITLQDWDITLEDIEGQTMGGRVKVAGTLNFADDTLRVKLPDVHATGIAVKQIPQAWNFPLRNLDGDLSASAHFTAMVNKDTAKIDGEVDGKIQQKNSKTKAEFQLLLKATDKGVQWSQDEPPTPLKGASARPLQAESTAAGPLPAGPIPLRIAARMVASRIPHADVGQQLSQTALQVQKAAQDNKNKTTSQEKPADKAKKEPARSSDKITLNLKLTDVPIEKYTKTLKLSYPITGTASLQIKTQIPTNALSDFKQYAATGKAQIKNLRIGDFHIESANVDIEYDNGILTLHKLEGLLPSNGGKVVGTAKLEAVPLGKLTAQVTAHHVHLEPFQVLLDKNAPGKASLGGSFSGQINASVLAEDLQKPAAWTVDAKVTSDELKAFGLALQKGLLEIAVKDGVAAVTSLRGLVDDMAVQGTAKVTLDGKYPFEASARVDQGKLNILEKLPESMRPPVELAGTIDAAVQASGTLQPLHWKLGGTVKATQLRAFQATVQKAEFAWNLDNETLKIHNLAGTVYSGEVSGQATIPLQPQQHGQIDLTIKNLNAAPLAGEVKLPFTLSGNIDGTLKASIGPQKADQPRDITANLDLASKELKLQGLPIENLTADIKVQEDAVEYSIKSKSLQGTIEADGKLPLRKTPQTKGSGLLKMTGVQLAPLWRQFYKNQTPPLTGTVALNFAYEHDAETLLPTGKGQLTVSNLKWEKRSLADNLQASIQLDAGSLRVGLLQAKFAGGQLQGNLTWNLALPTRGQFSLGLDRAEAKNIPLLSDLAAGDVNLTLDGTLDASAWFGRGSFVMGRGSLLDVPTSNLRMPFLWRLSPRDQSLGLQILSVSATIARGRVTGRGVLFAAPTGIRLDSHFNFANVELGSLARQASSLGSLGTARISGKATFNGTHIRSLNDLQGTIQADLGRNQAMTFPVLRQVAPIVGQSPSTSFTKGELRATLARAAVNIQRLSLESSSLRLFAEGRVGFNQRLNLNVVARTGQQDVANYRLRYLASKVPAVGPVPVGLIFQASRILNDRVLYMDVTGTLRSPIVRLRPLQTLSENAVRFFVEQAVPTPAP